jgi:hypothetical protein
MRQHEGKGNCRRTLRLARPKFLKLRLVHGGDFAEPFLDLFLGQRQGGERVDGQKQFAGFVLGHVQDIDFFFPISKRGVLADFMLAAHSPVST